MKRLVVCSVLLCGSSPLLAGSLEPIYSLKGLFEKVPKKLGLLTPEQRKLRSELDGMDGGIKDAENRVSVLTAERSLERFACASASDCSAMTSSSLVQRRGGLSWHWTDSDSFRLAPRAEVVHFETRTLSQLRYEDSLGYGLGMDSLWQLSEQFSAYASAGLLRLEESSGREGLFGVSSRINSGKLFVEARWIDMADSTRLSEAQDFSQVRIGFSRAFKGL